MFKVKNNYKSKLSLDEFSGKLCKTVTVAPQTFCYMKEPGAQTLRLAKKNCVVIEAIDPDLFEIENKRIARNIDVRNAKRFKAKSAIAILSASTVNKVDLECDIENKSKKRSKQ